MSLQLPELRPCLPTAMMSEGESKDSAGSECPVCYEKFRDLEGASRTLSCGHVFCHDCLVKYLLSTRVDGQVQRTIVCPICRYVTFLSKKSSRWPSMLDKSSQTLAVPMGLPSGPPMNTLGHTNPLATSQQPVWRTSLSQSTQLPLDSLPSLAREPQIFIISRHGMPLGEQDSVLPQRSLAELSEVSPAPSSNRSFCCRSRALLLITLIAVVAVVAAILPWVLLVRKQA
ncbi:RING finger protein 222 isoform X1 [Artibeus jamaicensis]|uniref:RING finger protein 222 isoform X1 n=2 Tax=Artibeus jamaicensis TaxID=9417 RepID=UPI00235AACE6|nr:RING finger protein 222 isoform X1 [Artibeus jamaicensis]